MSVSVSYQSVLTITETLTGNTVGLADTGKSVTHSSLNSTKSGLTTGSSQPCTQVASFRQLLAAGVATIDLTALTGTNGATVNGTGLKVQFIRVKALAANANPITLSEGAANGYALGGAAWTYTLQPGQEWTVDGNEATPDVGAADKTIDLAGTGAQGVDITIVLG